MHHLPHGLTRGAVGEHGVGTEIRSLASAASTARVLWYESNQAGAGAEEKV